MSTKPRLSASVDADVLKAAKAAVAEGRAPNVSAWVNDALRRHAEHDRRLRAIDTFLESYEAKHGAITNDEILAASKAARERALVVRGQRRPGSSSKPRRRGKSAA